MERSFQETRRPGGADQTIQQSWQTGPQDYLVQSQPPRRSFLSPLVIGLGALVLLVILGGVGGVAAYMLGIFPRSKTPANVANTATPTPDVSPPTVTVDLASIPGGTFTMGRNDGRDNEKPEHQVTVQDFLMDKTEVTNAEYYDFIKATNYKPPVHWENGKPLPGQEKAPVRYVSYDDANAFAAWRSKRDGVQYRLPTEEEWEYAARNGSKDNLYPWGDKYDPKCAVLDAPNNEPKPVGSQSCPDDWGVQDLIGNVFEWTSSRAALYPGSKGEVSASSEVSMMVRGGSALMKSSGKVAATSTFRQDVPAKKADAALGFRLVRSR
jgi:formylglycine-generating enzyme required for sulfatase activity